MEDKELNTEQRIIEAAKKVFFRKGLAGARMQDIADEAQINKAMLHYYFRSKEKLFELIMRDAVKKMIPQLNEIFNSDDSVFVKIEMIVDRYITGLVENPMIPSFVVSELNQNPSKVIHMMFGLSEKPAPFKFLNQIKEESQAGRIRQVDPTQLFVNLVSMCVFPIVASPIVKTVFDFDDNNFHKFLEHRKKAVAQFIIDSIRI